MANPPKIFVETLAGQQVTLPARATPGSAGYDLCSRVTIILAPGTFEKVPTGLKLAIPEGFEGQVRPRSGLAAKHGVTVLNAPGTIDSDYRGEVCIILVNHGKTPFEIQPGMRVAQLVIARVENVEFEKVENLETTGRGEGGFGSTGH